MYTGVQIPRTSGWQRVDKTTFYLIEEQSDGTID